MKKGLFLRIFNVTSFLIFAFVILIIYPQDIMGSAEQSKRSGEQKWRTTASADTLKNPFAENLTSARNGKKLFNTYCTTCHGKSGAGNRSYSASLSVKPRDLTSKAVQKESDGALFWKISAGEHPMIAWKYTLSEKQRWELVDYIRQLPKK